MSKLKMSVVLFTVLLLVMLQLQQEQAGAPLVNFGGVLLVKGTHKVICQTHVQVLHHNVGSRPLPPSRIIIYPKVSVNLFCFCEWDIQDPPLFLGLGLSFKIYHLHLQDFIFSFTVGGNSPPPQALSPQENGL